jgi:hypothetical protein
MGRFQLHPGRGAKNAKKEESETAPERNCLFASFEQLGGL